MNYEDIKLVRYFYKEFIFKPFAESPTVYINSKKYRQTENSVSAVN
jgi:hypothetical protein